MPTHPLVQAFNVVFEKAIQRTPASDDVRQRVTSLTDEITYSVFMYTARGLFERDKLIFLAQVTFQVQLDPPGCSGSACIFQDVKQVCIAHGEHDVCVLRGSPLVGTKEALGQERTERAWRAESWGCPGWTHVGGTDIQSRASCLPGRSDFYSLVFAQLSPRVPPNEFRLSGLTSHNEVGGDSGAWAVMPRITRPLWQGCTYTPRIKIGFEVCGYAGPWYSTAQNHTGGLEAGRETHYDVPPGIW